MSRADYEKLGLGKYDPAYVITCHCRHPENDTPITVYHYCDCFGDRMLVSETGRGSTMYANFPGGGGGYPKEWCTSEVGHNGTDGEATDMRSLKMFVAGCCPPEFTDEILAAGAMVD